MVGEELTDFVIAQLDDGSVLTERRNTIRKARFTRTENFQLQHFCEQLHMRPSDIIRGCLTYAAQLDQARKRQLIQSSLLEEHYHEDPYHVVQRANYGFQKKAPSDIFAYSMN